MGCGGSKEAGDYEEPVDAAGKAGSDAIERQLEAQQKEENKIVKLLVLGTGESGKSTVFKQMSRCVGSTGYTESELKQFRWIIHRNIIDAIKALIEAAQERDLELTEINEDIADRVLLYDGENLNPEMGETYARDCDSNDAPS